MTQGLLQIEDRVLILKDKADVFFQKYSPDQQRDTHGRWSRSGGNVSNRSMLSHIRATGLLVTSEPHRRAVEAYSDITDIPYALNALLRAGYTSEDFKKPISSLVSFYYEDSEATPPVESDLKEHNTSLHEITTRLDEVLAHAYLPKAITVYRGIRERGWLEKLKLNPGDILIDKGYVSTSRKFGRAEVAFAKRANAGVMLIDLPKGAHAIDLSLASSVSAIEQEVLLNRGAKLRFKKKIQHGKKWYYKFEWVE